MRIATWNVERLKHRGDIEQIRQCCVDVKADILVLTETDSRLELHFSNRYSTPSAKEAMPDMYALTENRVSIFSNFPIVRTIETFDKYTAGCVELETNRGKLIVYGTIMGIFGNREKFYKVDIRKQIEDIKIISGQGNICVAGDYNCSFSDNYYYTKEGRGSIIEAFSEVGVTILTSERPECIDHIAVSKDFVCGAEVLVDEWNYDKSLSDHKGIVVEMR